MIDLPTLPPDRLFKIPLHRISTCVVIQDDEGKVLLVGAIVLDPPVDQGELINYDVRGMSRGVIRFAMTKDLSKKVDMQALLPISPEEILLMNLKGVSFVPLQSGTLYIRMGIMDVSSRASTLTMPTGPGGSAADR